MVEIAKEVLPKGTINVVKEGAHTSGSSDVGDLTHIMPVLKFSTSGVSGQLHSAEFEVVDEDIAYITTAKIMALTAYRLLKNNAAEAEKLKRDFKPIFTIDEYKNYMDSFEYVINEDYSVD